MTDHRTRGGQSFRRRSFAERVITTMAAVPTGRVGRRIKRTLRPLYHNVLARSGNFEAVLPRGERVIVAPDHRHMTWNREEYEAFRSATPRGGIVLDVGANVGAYALLFAQWVGEGGRVYAFEPDPLAQQGLRTHIALNTLESRVTPIDCAIADRQGRARLAVFDAPGISRLSVDDDPGRTDAVEVGVTSIDEFCAERHLRPDVIKLDVEGAELPALRGASRTIAALGSDLQLFVEMHPKLWPSMGHSGEQLIRECEIQRLIPERLDGGTSNVWAIEGVCLRLRPAERCES
jgi:FkbM family methyltransferase